MSWRVRPGDCVTLLGQAVLVPLALAFMLTFLLQPLVAALHRRGSATASSDSGRHAAGTRVGTVGWRWSTIRQPGGRAAGYQDISNKRRDLPECEQGGVFEEIQATIAELTREFENNPSPTPTTQEPVAVTTTGSSLVSYVPSLLEFLADAGLVLVLLLFMLISYEDLRNRLFRLIGYARLTDTTKALDEAGQRIGRSLLMQAVVNGTYGCAVASGCFSSGSPMPAVWSLAAAVRFIPYVGPAVGRCCRLLSAWRYSGGRSRSWSAGSLCSWNS